jgi:hypothetical protein
VITSKKRLNKIARQKQSIRNSVWPDLDEGRLWSREKSDGWLSIPRAMPLLMRIMDMLAPKGKPVSQTYLDLWCRTYDDSFVIVSKPREMAYYSGFSGERAERTWAIRMRILKELGFVDIKEGTNGPIHYVLVLNPYHAIKRNYERGLVPEAAYNALKERVIEIRANDLEAAVTEDGEAPKRKVRKTRPLLQKRAAEAART